MTDAPESDGTEIGSGGCTTCMGRSRLLVGMSYPPGKTIAVRYEYEPCPDCQKGPHGFWARRTAHILKETRSRRVLAQVKP